MATNPLDRLLPNTEITRWGLIAGMVVLAYALILQWNSDYGQQANTEQVVNATADPLAGPVTDIPSEPVMDTEQTALSEDAATASEDLDVPQFVAAPQSTPGTQSSDAEAVNDLIQPDFAVAELSRLVKVETDVLHVWIDRRGGDIVKLTLPAYPVTVDQPDIPLTILDRSGERTFVAQSGLIGPDGIDASGEGRPLYSASADHFELEPGALEESGALNVTLSYSNDQQRVSKTYRFEQDSYLIGLQVTVENTSSAPLTSALFGQLKRDAQRPPGESSFTLGPRPFMGAAITTVEDRYSRMDFEDVDETRFTERQTDGWIAVAQHYFVSAWIPARGVNVDYYGRPHSDGQTYLFGFRAPAKQVQPNQSVEFNAQLYVGPKIRERLNKAADYLGLTVDYSFLWFIADYLILFLKLIQSVVGNWGVAIILLTLSIKIVLYPLSAASFRSMANMRRVAPDMKRIQERYKEDRQKQSSELMALYQKEKINPLGGCLPLLMQMPIFLALYWVLYESVELRQAPFFGWIADLSVMDPYFVLPILMGATMFLQTYLNPPVPDPVQAQVMKMMPIMFTVLFLFFPAGLVLYWLVNNVLSITQQWVITRQIEGSAKTAKAGGSAK